MSEAVVAKRYADALFQLADEKNKVKEAMSELAVVAKVFRENSKLMDVLEHPRIQHADKMKMLEDAFASCDKDVLNTIKILVERHRIGGIDQIAAHFTALYNEANGVAAATVYSVRALSDQEKDNVTASLTKQLDKQKVTIENIVDETLLGGLRIRVGNTIYDGSISGKLNRIKNNIVSISN